VHTAARRPCPPYWSQEDLVRHSKITKKTIADFERGATQPRANTLAQLTQAFDTAGIEFLNGKSPGVRVQALGCNRSSPAPAKNSSASSAPPT